MAEKTEEHLDILYSYFTKQENIVTSQMALSIGQQLLSKPKENYTVVKEIGRGATGVVYKIYSAEINSVAAMKKIPVAHLTHQQQNEKLKEVLLMKGLEHPNIIHYVASYIEDNELCIIMEYATLGDLAHVIYKIAYYY